MEDEVAQIKFSLLSCDWIGFDLDHTLIRYRLPELHQLIYQLMCEYLCENYHYNDQLLRTPYDHSFGVKALIYDSLDGNLIQLDSQGFVHTVLHGVRTRLSPAMIKQFYPNAFEAIEEDTGKRFLCIYTYFEHCISLLIEQIVEMIDEKLLIHEDETTKYSFFLAHFSAGFEYLFNDFNRGNYFSTIRSNLEKFICQRDDVRRWLEKLRAKDKRLFLATDLLCSYAFGRQWQNLFDLVLVDCKKPTFFDSANNENRRKFHQ